MIPDDDISRLLTVARPGDARLPRVSIAGGTYTVLIAGKDTAGRYTLIEMQVPPGAGPPPHRHDFEEMFTVVEGEIEATFRGATTTVRTGETINIPANAPHFFRNVSTTPARLHCLCSPAGQDEFFLAVGVPVGSHPDEAERAAIQAKAKALAPVYRTEML